MLPLVIVIGFVGGAAIHRFLLRKLPGEIASAEASSLTLTFGLSFFLAGGGLAVFGGSFRSVPYLTGAFQIAGISVPQAKLLAFGMAIVLAVVLGIFLRYTRLGCAIRATSQHIEGALACGVDIDRVRTMSFALGTAVACAAGTLMSMIYNLSPQMGVEFTVNAFAVVVIGGLGSYAGCILGAIILGLASEFTSYYIGASLSEAAPYVLFILVLLLRPSGLFGRRTA
jgi:branched-chain amino acid transport system permease protein